MKLNTMFLFTVFAFLSSFVASQPGGGLGGGGMMECTDMNMLDSIDRDSLMGVLQSIAGNATGGGGLAGILAPGNLPPPLANTLQCLLTAQGITPQLLADFLGGDQMVTQNVQIGALWDDEAIIAADLWASEPKILSALPGFDGIIGLATDEESALQGGATFVTDQQREELCGPGVAAPVTSAIGSVIGNIYNCEVAPNQHDGFPICFSWPVLPSSINREYLLYKRSDGVEFSPNCISTIPNYQYNERHCVVIFDQFQNRLLPDEDGYLYMEELEIIGPLMLVGPDGPVSMEGTKFTNPRDATAYASGPVFIGSRLVPLHNDGEGLPESFFNVFGGDTMFPNSGSSVYASQGLPLEEMYRLRTYYSGGMTPDGLTGLTPVMFDRYFSLNFSSGQTLSESNAGMLLEGTDTTVTVLGLADTGPYLEEGYTPCYSDDRDNYIDIIMHVDGDATVLETMLTSFTAFSQQPGLYNPGGPGPFPFDTVRYVAPAAEQTFPIDVDMNRTREVTYCVHQDGTTSTDIATCSSWLSSMEMKQIEQGQLFASQVNVILAMLRNGTATAGNETDGTEVDRSESSANSGVLVVAIAFIVASSMLRL